MQNPNLQQNIIGNQGLGTDLNQGLGTGLNQGFGTGLVQGSSVLPHSNLDPSLLNAGTTLVGTTGTTGLTRGVTGVGGHGQHLFQHGLGKATSTMSTGTGLGGIGTIVFRPIEGRFHKDTDIIGKMDPYCKFKIGWKRGKSSVAKDQGVHPTWAGDAISLKVKNQEFATIKVKDKDRLRPDSRLGKAKIPLAQVIQQGRVTQWIPIMKKDVVTGEIQVEMEFIPKAQTF